MVADLFLMSGVQQSNSGYADWNATGGLVPGAAGADFGFGINNTTSVFSQVTLWKRFAFAPSANAGTAQTYNVDYQGPLKAYGAAGTTNMGHEQSLGRALIEWGIATAPFLQDEAIAGSSLVTHWAKSAAWGGIYTNAVARAQAARAAAGIDPIACLHRQGETDTSTTSGNLAVVADGTYFKAFYNVFFADVGVPINTPIIVMMINSAQSGALSDVPAYRAAQLAWKAIDPRVILIDLDDIPLHADPHYDMCGQVSAGYRIATVLAALKGVPLFPPPATTTPFFKHAETCFSAAYNSGTSTPIPSNPRSGAVPEVGDLEILPCWSYSAVVTHTLATAAGFQQLGTQADSAFSGTVHKGQTLWYRVLQESHFFVDASGRRRTITPAFTFGVATLCIGGPIISYKGVDPVNPINAFVVGTQVTSTTSHTIPALTTTKPGCRVVLGGSDNGTSVSNTALTNPSLTGLTQRRDGRVNPGAGQVGYWIWDGVLAGTSLSTSAVTFSVASVPTSFAIALNPLGTATATIDIGAEGVTSTAQAFNFATASIDIGAELVVSTAQAINYATATIDIGTELVVSTASSGNSGHVKLYGLLQLDGATTPFNLVGPITTYAGDSMDMILTVSDDADTRIDLSPMSIVLQIRNKRADTAAVLVQKSTSAGTIAIRDQSVKLYTGQADIAITAADLDLPPGLYWIDVVVIQVSRRQHVIAPTEFTVSSVVNARN